MSKLISAVKTIFDKHPIAVNSIVYGGFCVSAEFSQQFLSKKILTEEQQPLDTNTIGRYAILGTFVTGPVLSNWYRWLDRTIPGTAPKIIIKKVLIDQFLFTPNFLILFYIGMSILERKADIFAECHSKLRSTFEANCAFWMPMQTINFALVPAKFRVVYVASCSFMWINVLCWFKRQDY